MARGPSPEQKKAIVAQIVAGSRAARGGGGEVDQQRNWKAGLSKTQFLSKSEQKRSQKALTSTFKGGGGGSSSGKGGSSGLMGFLGDVKDSAGDVLNKGLEVIDTPRAWALAAGTEAAKYGGKLTYELGINDMPDKPKSLDPKQLMAQGMAPEEAMRRAAKRELDIQRWEAQYDPSWDEFVDIGSNHKSFGDVLSQLEGRFKKGTAEGTGDAIKDAPWGVNFVAGMAGDAAFDPLLKIHAVEEGARATTKAIEVASKGTSSARDAELAKSAIAKLGRTKTVGSLTTEEAAAIGLKGGYKVAGKEVGGQGLRNTIFEANPLNKLRPAVGDAMAKSDWLEKVRGGENPFRAAARSGDPEKAFVGTVMERATSLERNVSGGIANDLREKAMHAFKGLTPEDQYDLMQSIQNRELAIPTHVGEARVQALRDWYDHALSVYEKETGRKVNKLTDYVNREITDEMKARMKKGKGTLGDVVADFVKGRKIAPGSELFGEVVPNLPENELLAWANTKAKEVLGHDMYKTDLKALVSSYADQVGKAAGRARANRYLFEAGLLDPAKEMVEGYSDRRLQSILKGEEVLGQRATQVAETASKHAGMADEIGFAEHQAKSAANARDAAARTAEAAAKTAADSEEAIAAARRGLDNVKPFETKLPPQADFTPEEWAKLEAEQNALPHGAAVPPQPPTVQPIIESISAATSPEEVAKLREEVAQYLRTKANLYQFGADDPGALEDLRRLSRMLGAKGTITPEQLPQIERGLQDAAQRMGSTTAEHVQTGWTTMPQRAGQEAAVPTHGAAAAEAGDESLHRLGQTLEDIAPSSTPARDRALANVEQATAAGEQATSAARAAAQEAEDHAAAVAQVGTQDAQAAARKTLASAERAARRTAEKAAENGTQAGKWLDANAHYHDARAYANDALKASTPEEAAVAHLRAQESMLAGQLEEKGIKLRQSQLRVAELQKPQQYERWINDVQGAAYRMLKDDAFTLNPDAQRLLDQVVRLTSNPKEVGAFLRTYDRALNWLKAWQIASPGFHVRNLFGGMFNNALEGINPSAYWDYLKANRAWSKGEEAFASFRKSNPQLAGWYEEARHAAGRGQIGSEFLSQGKTHILLPTTNNWWVKGSRRAGEDVEGFLRGSLIIDTMKNGGTLEEGIMRVNKVHFDYADLSNFERDVVKRVIPFYTWTRHNMPLQLEMMVRRPSVYSMYNNFTRNMSAGVPVEGIVPSYYSELGAYRTPFKEGNSRIYGTADPLPLGDISGNILEPEKYLSMMSPIIKAPVEIWAGKQFFKDLPLGGRQVDMPEVMQPFAPILKGMGVAKQTKNGWQMNDEAAYLIEQFAPQIARARRLVPNEKKYQERVVTNWLNFIFNQGLRVNTPSEKKAEKYRRYLEDTKAITIHVPK